MDNVSVESCPYCNRIQDKEEVEIIRKHGPLRCPVCDREGCFECMPAGRGCICTECEETRE
jgi:hypothetical protein